MRDPTVVQIGMRGLRPRTVPTELLIVTVPECVVRFVLTYSWPCIMTLPHIGRHYVVSVITAG